MSKKVFSVSCLLLLFALTAVACRSYEQDNTALRKLLPEREGFRWVYSGFAEYGHSMELTEPPSLEKDRTLYHITGLVDDPSGGEAPGPFDFSLTYQIEKGRLVRVLSEGSKLMDNRFPSLELIRAPLTKGTAWQQKVQDKAGKQSNLTGTIVEVISENGVSSYRVRYEDSANSYWEERIIQEGIGVVSVELPFDDSTIGYALYEEASGYPEQLQLNALLPPIGEQLRYFGLAEYAHSGALHPVSQTQAARVVEFIGDFEDGSGIPGTFRVQYTLDYATGTVIEKVISNSRTGTAEVNSLMHDPIVLKLPLQAGTQWTQPVTIDGNQYTMYARIVETSLVFNGQSQDRPVTRVRYEIPGVAGYFRETYLEERVFQDGRGMIAFSKLLPGEIGLSGKDLEDEQLVKQALQQHMFGYALDISFR